MRRVAAALALALAAFLATGASGGALRSGVTYAPCPEGEEGTAISAQDPEKHVVMEPNHYMTVCNYYPGGVVSGTSKLTLQADWVVPAGTESLGGVCGEASGANGIGSKTHEARVAAFGFTPDATWKAAMQRFLNSAEALAKPCGGNATHKYLFLVNARADAVVMKGIPATRLYATSDVHGAGSVYTASDSAAIEAAVGSIKVKHEYISDQLPDITMTLKVQDGGSVLKNAGGLAIHLSVKVSSSSISTCKGRSGSVALTDVPNKPATVSIGVCGTTIVLIDGRGPKGADPTNDVKVKID